MSSIQSNVQMNLGSIQQQSGTPVADRVSELLSEALGEMGLDLNDIHLVDSDDNGIEFSPEHISVQSTQPGDINLEALLGSSISTLV